MKNASIHSKLGGKNSTQFNFFPRFPLAAVSLQMRVRESQNPLFLAGTTRQEEVPQEQDPAPARTLPGLGLRREQLSASPGPWALLFACSPSPAGATPGAGCTPVQLHSFLWLQIAVVGGAALRQRTPSNPEVPVSFLFCLQSLNILNPEHTEQNLHSRQTDT